MKTGTLFISAAMGLGALTSAWAQQNYDFLGSSTSAWTPYAAGSLPAVLDTGTPGSVISTNSGWRYARTTDAAGTASGTWAEGAKYAMQFSGTVGNGTVWRVEFSDPTHLDGLQLYLQNLGSTGGDAASIWSMGTATPTTLFSGNFGGASGVGNSQQITGSFVFTVLAGGKTASVAGSLADSTGTLWSAGLSSFNLGTSASSLYAAFNISSMGSVTDINSLNWTFTPVPEPQSWALFASMGLLGLGLWRRNRSLKG